MQELDITLYDNKEGAVKITVAAEAAKDLHAFQRQLIQQEITRYGRDVVEDTNAVLRIITVMPSIKLVCVKVDRNPSPIYVLYRISTNTVGVTTTSESVDKGIKLATTYDSAIKVANVANQMFQSGQRVDIVREAKAKAGYYDGIDVVEVRAVEILENYEPSTILVISYRLKEE